MFHSTRHFFRLTRILFTLAYCRALFPLKRFKLLYFFLLPLTCMFPPIGSKREGERLALALAALGPSFIKLGQTLSTRADLVGAEIAADLAQLQDRLPAFPAARAIEIIEHELGGKLGDFFTTFEMQPVAAASIAQVHQAITLEGRNVAVKILRPGIREAFSRDIALFLWLAHLAEKRIKAFKRLKPVEVIHMLAESVKLEMDLRFEAAAASELKENCSEDAGIYVPEVDWQRTSRSVLTLEWVEGIPINDREALLAAGHDLNALASILAVTFFNQAYRDGFFHADMHPGNLFVRQDGRVVVVDFGIMGRLDKDTCLYVAEILRGFLSRDYLHVAKVHFEAGYVPADQSLAAFAQACRSIGEPIVGQPVNKISIARLLAQLFEITEDFKMETQPQLLLLQKTMMLVEGVGAMLNPDVNMWKLAEPWIEEWMRSNMGVQARIAHHAKETLRFMAELPRLVTDMHNFNNQLATEGLKLHPATIQMMIKGIQKEEKRWWKGVEKLFLAVVLVGLALLFLKG